MNTAEHSSSDRSPTPSDDPRAMRGFSRRRLALRSLRHHWRAHLPLALSVALCAAVLAGALLVGHAVTVHLKRLAGERLGAVVWALEGTPGVRFDASLARAVPDSGAVMRATAMVLADAAEGSGAQVNRVTLWGVDAAAWALMSGGDLRPPLGQEVVLNDSLARRLGVAAGDEVSLRVAEWSALPRDAPLATRGHEAPTVRRRARVAAVATDGQGGRFGLEARQSAPLNAFVSLSTLQEQAGWEERINLLVTPGDASGELGAGWRPRDLALQVVAEERIERLRGDSVFLDRVWVEALQGQAVFSYTYLVDAIETLDGVRRTPYSFVTGLTPQDDAELGLVPVELASDEALINAWTARELGVGEGDRIRVRARRWEGAGDPVSVDREFTIRRVVPMDEARVERARVPAFPGLTDVERCAQWDIGMDLDPDDLADEANESYWEEHGPTPKLLLTLESVQALAGTRFGEAMEARLPGRGMSLDQAGALTLASGERLELTAAEFGLQGRDVADEALAAVQGAMDFGGLFLGLSLFLVGAGALLAGLLCALGLARNRTELGAYGAVGFSAAVQRGLVARELTGVTGAAAVLGALGGAGYAALLLLALEQGWAGALADASPPFAWSTRAVATGALGAWSLALLVLGLVLQWTLRRPSERLLQRMGSGAGRGMTPARRAWASPATVVVSVGVLIVAMRWARQGPLAALAGGALVLTAGVSAYALWARALACRPPGEIARDARAYGRRAAQLRPGREVAVMAVLACGLFLVSAVAAMRQDVARNADQPGAATGGYQWYTDLSVPVVPRDLPRRDDLSIVALPVVEGEDAGCLNLHRVRAPRLIGIPVRRFAAEGRFGLADEWLSLDRPLAGGRVPAWTGDQDTATWGLQVRLDEQTGGELQYRAGGGRDWTLRLVGAPPHRLTLFQGSVLVSEDWLREAYPGLGGATLLLTEVARGEAHPEEDPVGWLHRQLQRHGPETESTVARLRGLYRVEATYLDMFLVLGGLGLLVATVGVGLVLLRNAEERSDELRLLMLLGFERRDRAALLWRAALPSQLVGCVVGGIAAWVAVWPALAAPGATIPWRGLLGLWALTGGLGLAWTLGLARHAAARPERR